MRATTAIVAPLRRAEGALTGLSEDRDLGVLGALAVGLSFPVHSISLEVALIAIRNSPHLLQVALRMDYDDPEAVAEVEADQVADG